MTSFDFLYSFRLACIHYITTAISRFGTKINQPVSTFYNIRIVFYNKDGMSLFNQCIKRREQFFYIMEVEACCRLIKNEKYFIIALPFSKKRGQLYPLRFSAGQSIG